MAGAVLGEWIDKVGQMAPHFLWPLPPLIKRYSAMDAKVCLLIWDKIKDKIQSVSNASNNNGKQEYDDDDDREFDNDGYDINGYDY